MTPPRRNDSAWAGVPIGYSVVSSVAAGLLLGWVLGAGLDHLFHTPHIVLAILMPAGAALGAYLVHLHYGRPRDGRS